MVVATFGNTINVHFLTIYQLHLTLFYCALAIQLLKYELMTVEF